MQKEDLLKEKEEITKEILDLREDLKKTNDSVQNVGNTVAFYKVLFPPIIIAIGLGFILSKLGLVDNSKGEVALVILLFIIILFITSKISKKKIKENKNKYIAERISIQKLIVKKSKRLSDIESELKLIEN